MRLACPGQARAPRGLWSLPSTLLQVPAFCARMETCIADHLAAPFTCPMARWEGLKVRVREAAVAFHRQHAAHQRRQAWDLLRAKAAARRGFAAHPADPALAQAWRHAAHRARRHLEEREHARGLAAQAVWAQQGETGTAWFHRLGRTRPPRAPITALQPPGPASPGAALVEGSAEVLAGLAAFFDGDAGGLFLQARG